jgi:hypothetical protein
MGREKRVHECFKVWPPPLSQGVADLPLIVDTFARELGADWRKPLVQACLETLGFVIFGEEVVSRSKRFDQLVT